MVPPILRKNKQLANFYYISMQILHNLKKNYKFFISSNFDYG